MSDEVLKKVKQDLVAAHVTLQLAQDYLDILDDMGKIGLDGNQVIAKVLDDLQRFDWKEQ